MNSKPYRASDCKSLRETRCEVLLTLESVLSFSWLIKILTGRRSNERLKIAANQKAWTQISAPALDFLVLYRCVTDANVRECDNVGWLGKVMFHDDVTGSDRAEAREVPAMDLFQREVPKLCDFPT